MFTRVLHGKRLKAREGTEKLLGFSTKSLVRMNVLSPVQ